MKICLAGEGAQGITHADALQNIEGIEIATLAGGIAAEAEAFAADATGNSVPMVTALRKLNRENLANLTPHPWYSGFHYDHPALLEREAALKTLNQADTSS